MNTKFGLAHKNWLISQFNGTLATTRHELRLLVFTPLSYLFQIGFLISLTSCVFLIADFYSTDEVSLRLQIIFLPWIGLILVPALAMRSWPDENSDRSFELITTLPVNTGAVVMGKFLSGYLILLITLFCTLPMVGTLFFLGKPDVGILVSSYLGSALTLGLFYSISLLASALTREPISAFVLSLVTLFILMLLGWDVFSRLLDGNFSANFINIMTFLSPYTWLLRMSQGVIEFGGIFYFFSIIFGALWATKIAVEIRYLGSISVRTCFRGIIKLAVVAVVFAISMTLLSSLPFSLDMTESGEFTLHEGTIKIVKRLPEKTVVTLHWSESETSIPSNIKSHARRIRNLLQNMSAISDKKLVFQEIDPKPDTNKEIESLVSGIQKIPMSSGDSFFLGLTAAQGERKGFIAYLDNRRERLTEYDIVNILNGLTRKKTPKIGILSPLIPSISATQNQEGLSFISELKKSYDLAVIPHFRSSLPQGLNVLLIIDATILQEEMLYSIDQFLMSGGSLIVMIDPFLRFKKSSNTVNPEPSKKINDVSDLLNQYGLKYVGKSVIGDLDSASMVADRENRRMNYPFWMRIRGDGLSSGHATTASLNEVFMVEGGNIEILDQVRGKPLITTSQNSGKLDRREFLRKEPRQLIPDFKIDNISRTVAAVLQGTFTSAFPTPPNFNTSKIHKLKGTQPAVIFAISDVDWLFDPFSILPLGWPCTIPSIDSWPQYRCSGPLPALVAKNSRIEKPPALVRMLEPVGTAAMNAAT